MIINYLKRKAEEFNKKWRPHPYTSKYLLEFIEFIKQEIKQEKRK